MGGCASVRRSWASPARTNPDALINPPPVPGPEDDAASAYRLVFDPAEPRRWPAGMLPFVDLGCGASLCVDCLNSPHVVYAFDPDRLGPDIQTPEGLTPEEQDAFMEPYLEAYEDNLDLRDLSQQCWQKVSDSAEAFWQQWCEEPMSGFFDPRHD